MTASQTRRQALLRTGAALSLAAFDGAARAAAVRAPNILFILADDLGIGDLGCYGQTAFATPNLDRLAADGLLLTQAYANSAVCSATRVGLLTGRYQYRLPVGLFEPLTGPDAIPLHVPPEQPTIASSLKSLGYRTSLIGKWHIGALPEHSPRQSGYDDYLSFEGGYSDYFTHSGPAKKGAGLWKNDRKVERPGYLTDVLAAEAVAEIAAAGRGAKPFFMSLHFNAPHWPWEGPGDEAVAVALKEARHEDGGNLAKYGEMVTAMDAAIGRVLDAVRATGREDDTLVVFTSDNGGERFSQMWPLIGQKGELLEGGIRVPGLVRWPARIARGRRSDQVAISMDWMPTFLRVAGGAPDPRYPSDGQDLLDVLTGAAPSHPRELYWRYKAAEQAALREGDWKYLKLGGKEFLFDLAADVHERADRKGAEPTRFAAMKADFAAWNATMLPYPANSFSETPKGRNADRY